MSECDSILVLGAGELGLSILQSLTSHPQISQNKIPITVLLRSIDPSTKLKRAQIAKLTSLSHPVSILTVDISSTPLPSLTSLFKSYHTIISCTGFSGPPGTQLKIAHAVLDARVKRYLPWQFGLDYDAIGRGSGQKLFDEQLDVRELLRGDRNRETKWTIVSTGLFMTFLFEDGFVVDVRDGDKDKKAKVKVTALGSWDNKVTVTDVGEIGKIVADVVFAGPAVAHEVENQVVYTAGETMTYGLLARLVEEELGGQREVKREVLTVAVLEEMLRQDSENGMLNYKLVFAKGVGTAWDMETTWSWKRGIRTVGLREWIRTNIKL